MEIQTLDEVQFHAMGNGMSDYNIHLCQAMLEYQPVLKQLALMLKEKGYFHESAEHILALSMIIDEATEDYSL